MENPINKHQLFGDNKYKPIEETILLKPISLRVAKLLNKHTLITPDQVSFFGFFLTLLTSYFIITKPREIILLIVLLFTSIVFDKIDGDLARAKGIAGMKGQYVDGFLDVLGEVILIAAWVLAFTNGDSILILISIGATALFNYHGVATPFYLNTTPNTHKESTDLSFINKLAINLGYGRAKLFILMMLLLVIGKPFFLFYILPLLILYTLTLYYRNIFIKGLTKR